MKPPETRVVQIVTTATASIRETWLIEVREDDDVTVANALEVLDEGARFRLISLTDETIGDETDREVEEVRYQ